MAITVEPGIYIRPDALDNLPKTPENEKFIEAVRPAFEKYKGIGVRIEDDVVTTGRAQGDFRGYSVEAGRRGGGHRAVAEGAEDHSIALRVRAGQSAE